jgi:hypothetical protein
MGIYSPSRRRGKNYSFIYDNLLEYGVNPANEAKFRAKVAGQSICASNISQLGGSAS